MVLNSSDWHDREVSSSTAAATAAVSSVLTKTILYPFDTLKTTRQASIAQPRSIANLYRGILPKLALYGPYQAIYMATYTAVRDPIQEKFPGISGYALAGATAELSGAFIRVPMEVVKQRMQVHRDKTLHSVVRTAANDLVHFSSNRRLFLAQTLIHDIPYGIVQWTVYQQLHNNWGTGNSTADGMVIGSAAGAVAALITTPCDVIKVRMVTAVKPSPFMEIVARHELFRGGLYRVLHVAPATGLYFAIFNSLYSLMSS